MNKFFKIVVISLLFSGCCSISECFQYTSQVALVPTTVMIKSAERKIVGAVYLSSPKTLTKLANNKNSEVNVDYKIKISNKFGLKHNSTANDVKFKNEDFYLDGYYVKMDKKESSNNYTIYKYTYGFIFPKTQLKDFHGTIELAPIILVDKQTKETIKKNIHIKIKGIKHS